MHFSRYSGRGANRKYTLLYCIRLTFHGTYAIFVNQFWDGNYICKYTHIHIQSWRQKWFICSAYNYTYNIINMSGQCIRQNTCLQMVTEYKAATSQTQTASPALNIPSVLPMTSPQVTASSQTLLHSSPHTALLYLYTTYWFYCSQTFLY